MLRQLDTLELHTAMTLASVIAFRMLGLFMIMPVFMLLTVDMPGFTPATAGLAVGIYGLTQAILQRPFGWLSDRIGRRPVMLAGLALFGAGGALAALADSMTMLIAGRALQGCGAIAGVALALAADHTRPQNRGVVMAIIGMAIGASFLLSMVVAVPLSTILGLRGLFWLTTGLAVLGMLMVLSMPSTTGKTEDDLHESGQSSLAWLFALSVFLLHAVMTLLFVVLPGMLVSRYGFGLEYHWRIYVPSVLGSVLLVFPLLRRLGQRRQEAAAVPLAFLVLGVALGLMPLGRSLLAMLLFAMVFFLAFNLLEAAMPSVVSQLTGNRGRGRKMGLYTTFQFLGAFAGGLGGGWLLGASGSVAALSLAGALCAAWAVCLALWLKHGGEGQQG
ncbi:MAG: MFS transporter [Lysobacterales bacterium]